jgi:ABC-type transport system substrate-binding protein
VNATYYSNPAFDRLYEEAMAERDDAKRAAIYRRAAAIIIDDCPWLFMTTEETVSLRQPWVKNDPLNAIGIYYFKNLILDRGGVPSP